MVGHLGGMNWRRLYIYDAQYGMKNNHTQGVRGVNPIMALLETLVMSIGILGNSSVNLSPMFSKNKKVEPIQGSRSINPSS